MKKKQKQNRNLFFNLSTTKQCKYFVAEEVEEAQHEKVHEKEKNREIRKVIAKGTVNDQITGCWYRKKEERYFYLYRYFALHLCFTVSCILYLCSSGLTFLYFIFSNSLFFTKQNQGVLLLTMTVSHKNHRNVHVKCIDNFQGTSAID